MNQDQTINQPGLSKSARTGHFPEVITSPGFLLGDAMRRLDLTGKRFGRLSVKGFSHTDKHRNTYWKCDCDCGKETVVQGGHLTKANGTRSCGCLIGESTRKRFTTHNMVHSSEYVSWQTMIQRCTNPNNNRYQDYGGRGIHVCESWKQFENFITDMGKRPDGLTLERRDNEKGYSPDNCYWATRTQQQRNMRMPKTNTSGVMGVRFRVGKYEARIRAGERSIYLGRFKTIEEAAKARRQGEIKYWKKGE